MLLDSTSRSHSSGSQKGTKSNEEFVVETAGDRLLGTKKVGVSFSLRPLGSTYFHASKCSCFFRENYNSGSREGDTWLPMPPRRFAF